MNKKEKPFDILEKGVRFECQGSGGCCVSRGEYGYVYLNLKDRRKMAEHFSMNTSAFTKKYCHRSEDGLYYLKEDPTLKDCRFLKGTKCEVYLARPMQCRTWPFWPEVMNAKSWSEEVENFCPGIGKGKYYSPEEIKEVLEWQKRAEEQA